MAEIALFHHAHGRTSGVLAFADELRQAGHSVHVPDLFEGQTFERLEDGVGYAEQVGFGTIVDRGVLAAEGLPPALVYVGWSLGVLPAQKLAQTRAGATGAVLLEACVPAHEFGSPWPPGVPLQVHGMDADELFADEGDVDAARELVTRVEDAELFLYAGNRHLFADNGLPSYDQAAAQLLLDRVLSFLDAEA